MFLKKDNLTIRNAAIEDAVLLTSWWNNTIIMEHAGWHNGLNTTVEEVTKQIIEYGENIEQRMILEIDSIPVGEMSYRRFDGNIAQIGIKICNFDLHDKGYGTKFLKMMINSLFNDLNFEKIITDTNFNNKRAQHVCEKIGFKNVKENIDARKNTLGELQSYIDYELIKSDFIPL